MSERAARRPALSWNWTELGELGNLDFYLPYSTLLYSTSTFIGRCCVNQVSSFLFFSFSFFLFLFLSRKVLDR